MSPKHGALLNSCSDRSLQSFLTTLPLLIPSIQLHHYGNWLDVSPLQPNLCHAATSATDMEVVPHNASCTPDAACPHAVARLEPLGRWIMCFKMCDDSSARDNPISSKMCKSKQPVKGNLVASWLRVGGWWSGKFSYSCSLLPIFHFFAFPLTKLQENICHGFKRFISFKAEGAGRPTHQWDHAILPALTRTG